MCSSIDTATDTIANLAPWAPKAESGWRGFTTMPVPTTASVCWWIACGREESARTTRGWAFGARTSRRRRNCVSGTTMSRNVSANSRRATRRSCRQSGARRMRKMTKRGVVTLVTATREVDGSHAAVLAKLLKGK